MEDADRHYLMILTLGLIRIRDADLRRTSQDLVKAEAEHLHNLPSLIGEMNVLRHRFYLDVERAAYLEALRAGGDQEALEFASQYYLPLWQKLERLL